MSLDRIEELKKESTEYPQDLSVLRELVKEEASFLDSQPAALEDALARKAAAEAKAQRMRRKLEVLNKEREESAIHTPTREEVESYSRSWMTNMVEFKKRRELLRFFLNYSAADVKDADLAVVSGWLDSWPAFLAESDATVRSLRHFERSVRGTHPLPSARALSDALDEVCRLQLQARSTIGHERYRRNARSTESEEEFMYSQEQLLDWCHKQLETLDDLSSLEDLCEFSASFHSNVPVMESNFLVLMEQSESLMGNPRVQDALQEVNAAWAHLCIGTYTKLHAAAEDAHSRSGLETHCANWNRSVAPQLRVFLNGTQKTLERMCAAKRGDAAAQAMHERCDEIVRENNAHTIVCTHLSDFMVREECIRPHADALRAELTSSVTTKILTFPTYESYEGREEYKVRMEELREWIDVHSEKSTYANLLARLGETKAMIKEYADAMFPDDGENE